MAAPPGNKYAIGNKGGRPRIIQNAQELEERIEEYFKWAEGEWKTRDVHEITYTPEGQKIIGKQLFDEWGDPVTETKWIREPETITITGLALFCGFSSRQMLNEYELTEEFGDLIKHAKVRVEREYEKKLTGTNAAGPIFALKNMKWQDQQQITGDGGAPLIPPQQTVVLKMPPGIELNLPSNTDGQ